MDFFRTKTHFYAAHVTGPSHVQLGLSVSENASGKFQIVKRPAVLQQGQGELDEKEIEKQVRAAVVEANQEFGTSYCVEEIVYFENDSPRYQFYAICAYRIIEALASGSKSTFRVSDPA